MLYLKNVDVLDVEANALIYSTNVLLNCSGGVGACLVHRYGKKLQTGLHRLLAASGRRFAEQGEIFDLTFDETPYSRIFHCCPCDGWYDTSPEIVATILDQCLSICHLDPEIETVALSALATGYGRMELEAFVETIGRISVPAGLEVILAIDHAFSFQQACKTIVAQRLPIDYSLTR